jgi:hypothetical protein
MSNKGGEKQIQPGRYWKPKEDGPGSPDQKEILSKSREQNFKAKRRCLPFRWPDRIESDMKQGTHEVRKGGRGGK